jgi:hypothetical protein
MGIYSYKELEHKIKAEGQLTEEEAEEVNTQLAQQAISGKKDGHYKDERRINT